MAGRVALGAGGPAISLLGLGGNTIGRDCDGDETRAVVHAALDAGIAFVDTADSYGNGRSEALLGEVLEGRRDEVVLATKFGMDVGDANGPPTGPRGGRAYVRQSVEASLRRLRTDWIDLYQYHVPDGVTPLAETLAALDELVQEGKVRWVGSSNLGASEVVEAAGAAADLGLAPFVGTQAQYSLLHRAPERDLLAACAEHGVGFVPWYPLARGLLTGKYRGGDAPARSRLAGVASGLPATARARVDALAGLAEERGVPLLHLALGGLAAQPGVTAVIVGATRPEQVRANVEAVSWSPSADDLAAIDAIVPRGGVWL